MEPRLEPRSYPTGNPRCPRSAWLTLGQMLCADRGGTQPPFQGESPPVASDICDGRRAQRVSLRFSARRLRGADTTLAALIPLSGPPHGSPGAPGTRSLRLALPDAYCLPAAVLRLSPMEDPATSIVPADFPTAPGPRAPWLIVVVLAQPQGQRPGASRQGCCVTTPEAVAVLLVPNTSEYAPSV